MALLRGLRYRGAIVRAISDELAGALSLAPERPQVRLDVARAQHAKYVDALRPLVERVVELPAEPGCPDSCFVEDTAVVVGREALVAHMGHPSRRPETRAVAAALESLGVDVVWMSSAPASSATLDGGDVLFTGREFFVGVSHRTSRAGVEALAARFPAYRVHAVPLFDIVCDAYGLWPAFEALVSTLDRSVSTTPSGSSSPSSSSSSSSSYSSSSSSTSSSSSSSASSSASAAPTSLPPTITAATHGRGAALVASLLQDPARTQAALSMAPATLLSASQRAAITELFATLHLKSLLSLCGPDQLAVGDTPVGRAVGAHVVRESGKAELRSAASSASPFSSSSSSTSSTTSSTSRSAPLQPVRVPDIAAANVVLIGDALVMRAAHEYPRSAEVLRAAAAQRRGRVVEVDASELAKVDAALTCCSILLEV